MKRLFYFFAIMAISLITFSSCEPSTKEPDKDKDKNAEYVDLGLSVKWAKCNVGANKPEEYGDYFAWGEIESKTDYDWDTYKYWDGSDVTKYNEEDGKTQLDTEDDVAISKLGNDWRIPTKAELDELANNCSWEWTTENGVNGYSVTGQNGNSIFLPAAGYIIPDGLKYDGTEGFYFSKTLSSTYTSHGHGLYLSSEGKYVGHDIRSFGLTIRPVYVK